MIKNSLRTQLCRSGWCDRFMTSLCQVFAQTVRLIQLWTAQAAWAGGDAACDVACDHFNFPLGVINTKENRLLCALILSYVLVTMSYILKIAPGSLELPLVHANSLWTGHNSEMQIAPGFRQLISRLGVFMSPVSYNINAKDTYMEKALSHVTSLQKSWWMKQTWQLITLCLHPSVLDDQQSSYKYITLKMAFIK